MNRPLPLTSWCAPDRRTATDRGRRTDRSTDRCFVKTEGRSDELDIDGTHRPIGCLGFPFGVQAWSHVFGLFTASGIPQRSQQGWSMFVLLIFNEHVSGFV